MGQVYMCVTKSWLSKAFWRFSKHHDSWNEKAVFHHTDFSKKCVLYLSGSKFPNNLPGKKYIIINQGKQVFLWKNSFKQTQINGHLMLVNYG